METNGVVKEDGCGLKMAKTHLVQPSVSQGATDNTTPVADGPI